MRNALFVLILFAFSACEAPKVPLPSVTGKAGELVVVMNETLWKQAAGDTVFNSLSQHVYGLPQPEPMFNVVHIKKNAFSKIFQSHRNILVANIGEGHQKKIELKSNVWATPQIVVEISAPDAATFIQLFTESLNRIISQVLKKEEERTLRSYRAQINHDAVALLSSNHFLKLAIPKGYNIARTEADFTWLRYETKDVTQSILVYTEPYKRPNTFTKDGMVSVADSITKIFVPGPTKGTYMSTYLEYPPLFTETALANIYTSSLKGLWHVDGALMGGPFVIYALLDEPRNRVIYLHGFVFAPGKNKRNYLRQVEAIINSLEVI
ncbi:DUF4837 family protein [Bacteroidota bacterium]